MTDVTKYKSVAIKIDVYNKAKPMAQKKYMSMGSYLHYLIDKEHNQENDQSSVQNGEDHDVRPTEQR
jgi:macrodomain Ter protein organizer (MatP/YcbG family)